MQPSRPIHPGRILPFGSARDGGARGSLRLSRGDRIAIAEHPKEPNKADSHQPSARPILLWAIVHPSAVASLSPKRR